MATTITNQASLNFEYNGQAGTAQSNIATAILNDPLAVTKRTVATGYRAGQEITYVISVTNSGAVSISNVNVNDDLGAYPVTGGTAQPLTYEGPSLLYINSVYSGTLTPTTGDDGATFVIPNLPAGATALIIMKTRANSTAPLGAAGAITNTATVTAEGIADAVDNSVTLPVEEYADVSLNKSMEPSSVLDGSSITYTFELVNRGNAEATNVVLTDVFSPAPEAGSITVRVGDDILTAGEYTYDGTTLTVPSTTGTPLTLAAAGQVTDPATGVTTVNPTSLTITVTGTL